MLLSGFDDFGNFLRNSDSFNELM